MVKKKKNTFRVAFLIEAADGRIQRSRTFGAQKLIAALKHGIKVFIPVVISLHVINMAG